MLNQTLRDLDYACRVFRRWLVTTLAAVLAFVAVAAGISWTKGERPPTHRVQPGNLVVVAMNGLTWSDINPDTTPVLWGMAHRGAVGNQFVRVISAHSCADAAWVTLGSGTRTPLGYGPSFAPSSGTNSLCSPGVRGVYRPVTHSYVFPQWPTWSKAAIRRNIPSRMGLVATTLEKHGQCVAAVGERAALGAADRQGVVRHFSYDVGHADLTACPVTFVDLNGRNDSALGDLIRQAPPRTTFLVTGLTDEDRPESPRAVLLGGPTVNTGLLRSRSTRQPGIVQTTDLSAFIMERVHNPPHLGEGRPLSVENRPAAASVRGVSNMQTLLRTEHNLIVPFFLRVGIVTLVAVFLGILISIQARRTRDEHLLAARRRWWSFWAAVAGAIPVATFLANLVSWYRSDHALAVLCLAVVVAAVPIAVVALLGPWRRWTPGPALFIAAVTALTLAMDTVQGAPLQLVSVLGLQPVYGGRFYGMGNVGYSVFMTASLLCAALLAGRYRAMKRPRLAMLTVLAICVPAVLVNGIPQWGNEGGGSAAFIPALVYLAMRARGMRITLTRLALAGMAGALFTLGLAWLDYLRGEAHRTHLGDIFAGLIGDGQVNPVKRVLYTNWHMLNSAWFNWTVPALLVICFVLVAFPEGPGRPLKPLFVRVPMLRHGLIAVVMMWGFGFIANDSGTSIPPTGAMVAVPFVILVGARMASPHTQEGPNEPEIGRVTREAAAARRQAGEAAAT